jgi:apolipoprotein N-acyltransferase
MNSRLGSVLIKVAVAAGAGVLLRFAVGLRPVWWVVWLAPIPLLLMAFRIRPRDARWMVFLAAAIGTSCNYHYFRLVMPLPAVLAAIAAQTLLWGFLIFATRRVVVRYKAWWTVFAYPVLWVAFDTLAAALLPDGNWGSLAYSQSDRLPILQVASLFGTAGLLFLIALVPSALALAIAYGRSLRRGWIAYAITAILLASSIFYGYHRLREPARGVETTFGLVSIDDPIGLRASASYASNILGEYDRRVEELAAQGAQVVVLPEKIAMITPAKAAEWQQHFSALAGQSRAWLEVGVGIDDGKRPTNWAWLFAPDGTLAASYEKHHMAPPERRDHYSAGADYTLQIVDGQSYGLAICKDMHFAALGRAYGVRHAAVMLVPAWDFDYLDGWMEARTTVVRGIENGYTIVRASREGLLTVSDPYGRILAEASSSEMPGRSLLAKVAVSAPVTTLYTRTGDVFGWICVAAGAVFLTLGRARRRAGLSTKG